MSTDIGDVLAKAWEAVKESGIPAPLHELALGRAIDFLLDGSAAPTRQGDDGGGQGGSGGQQQSGSGGTGSATGAASDEDDFYNKMSAGTGVSKSLLERLVHIHENAPHVLLKTSQLPKEGSAAQKLIALLISVGTHYWTGETDIDLRLVRDEVNQFNRMDSNFSKNVDKIENLTFTGVRGGSKKIKIRKAYLDTFGSEVQKYGQFTE